MSSAQYLVVTFSGIKIDSKSMENYSFVYGK